MDDTRLECFRKLMGLCWTIKKESRQFLSARGLSWNQYSVLKNIFPGEELTLSEISTRTKKENSNVTALVDFFEQKGIMRRINDRADRRVIRVTLTENGISERENITGEHDEFVKKLFISLQEEEMKGLIAMLDVFLEKINVNINKENY